MATTWTKRGMRAVLPTNSYLSLLERRLPEGDNQTFPVGAPLAFSSGLLVVWSSGNLAYLSAREGQNTTGDIYTQAYMLVPGVELEANFLGSAAADNVIAAADLGGPFDIASSSTLIGGTEAGWYIQDSTSATMVRISELKASSPEANAIESVPAIGDTNCRVWAAPLIANLHWYD